eukprot:3129594-Prymnesium_polylepis.1
MRQRILRPAAVVILPPQRDERREAAEREQIVEPAGARRLLALFAPPARGLCGRRGRCSCRLARVGGARVGVRRRRRRLLDGPHSRRRGHVASRSSFPSAACVAAALCAAKQASVAQVAGSDIPTFRSRRDGLLADGRCCRQRRYRVMAYYGGRHLDSPHPPPPSFFLIFGACRHAAETR